jgi:hypothetical protein
MRSTECVRLVEACVAFGKRDLFTYAIVDGGFGSSVGMYGYASTDGLHGKTSGTGEHEIHAHPGVDKVGGWGCMVVDRQCGWLVDRLSLD